ncbi:MAG: NUMOD4 domain-containing protein [Betaproteobacteria bacterium]
MLKDVPEYENFYVVSDDGEVFNARGKKLVGWINRDGYPCVGLRKGGAKKSFLVHRLVLLAFPWSCTKRIRS